MININKQSTFIVGAIASIFISTNVIAKDSEKSKIPLKELRNFMTIYHQIRHNYVEKVDPEELIRNAISGMVSKLDPHSAYMLPDNFKELSINTSGKFGGLGIEVGMENGFVKVISPIDDTPAMRAGIKAGDLIIKIDDTHVKGLTLNDAVKLMRGIVGDPISITVMREGTPRPFVVKIIRAEIKIRSVRSKLLKKNLGYIRISQFQTGTTKSLHKHYDTLVEKNSNKPLKGLILDLRNNPGGVLRGAVGVSDAFIDSGKIVYTKGRAEGSGSTFLAHRKTIIPSDTPMIVLINGGSASASEIVAGALQDHKRAIIMGTQSFGKGSVQTVMPLSEGAGLKITTARYFTPNGRSIQAKGIKPDIESHFVDIKSESIKKNNIFSMSEKGLSGHLENPEDNKKPTTDKSKEIKSDKGDKSNKSDKSDKSDKDDPTKGLIKKDFVLYEALNVLIGLSLLK